MQMLNNCFSLRPNDEWSSENEIVFNSNKTVFQMEIIEFLEESVFNEKFNQVPNTL